MANRVERRARLYRSFLSGASVLIALAFPATGANVSGTLAVDTTWSLVGSPYVITGALTVASGAKLTISPGVIIQGRPNSPFTVNGTISAIGTSNSPIVFTRDTNVVKASSIRIIGSSAGFLSATGVFQYCNFTYLTNDNFAISSIYAVVSIADCNFSNTSASSYSTIRSELSVLNVIRSTSSWASAFVSAGNSCGVISSNKASSSGDMIWCHGPHSVNTQAWVISYNKLGPCFDDAIDVGDFPTVLSRSHYIIGNIVTGCTDKAINLKTMKAIVRNNIVWRSTTAMDGSGAMEMIAANNTFAHCSNGVTFLTSQTNPVIYSTLINTILWNLNPSNFPLIPVATQTLAIVGATQYVFKADYCYIPQATPLEGVSNMVNVDPMFVNVNAGDLRLLDESPCLENGYAQSWMSNAKDAFDGNRNEGKTVDIGAYEAPDPTIAPMGTSRAWLNLYFNGTNYSQLEMMDPDYDGALTWEEYVAGTHPSNAASVFKIYEIKETTGNRYLLSWISSPSERRYTLFNANSVSNLYATNNIVTNDIHGTIDGINSFYIPIPTNRRVFWGLQCIATN